MKLAVILAAFASLCTANSLEAESLEATSLEIEVEKVPHVLEEHSPTEAQPEGNVPGGPPSFLAVAVVGPVEEEAAPLEVFSPEETEEEEALEEPLEVEVLLEVEEPLVVEVPLEEEYSSEGSSLESSLEEPALKREEGFLDGVPGLEGLATPLTQGANFLADGVTAVLSMGAAPLAAINSAIGGVFDTKMFGGVLEPFVRPLMGNIRGSEVAKRSLHHHGGKGGYGGGYGYGVQSYPISVPYAYPVAVPYVVPSSPAVSAPLVTLPYLNSATTYPSPWTYTYY